MGMTCWTHRNSKTTGLPQNSCPGCWRLYLYEQENRPATTQELLGVLNTVLDLMEDSRCDMDRLVNKEIADHVASKHD